MKLITRCPECSTAFRVHEEQLSARRGKVRCGACGLVFDAYGSLVEVLRERRPAAEAAQRAAAPAVAQGGASRAPASASGSTLPLASIGPAPHSRFSVEAVTIWPDDFQAGTTAPLPSVSAAPRKPSPEPAMAAAAIGPGEGMVSLPGPAPGTAWLPPRSAPAGDPAGFDFAALDPARRSPAVWKVVAFVLALLLALQVTFVYRSLIAATFPGMRPLFVALCETLTCTIAVPRHVELLKLESSDLRADTDRVLSLTAVIRNQARYEQAYPSLLLTLMDERNRPLARRLVPPAEYLGIDPGDHQAIPSGGMVTARITLEAGVRADAYEVLLVYP